MAAERGTDLQQLEGCLDLLYQDVDLDSALRQPEVLLERGEQVVPQCCFLGRLDLGQVEDDGCSRVGAAAGGC